MARSSQHRRHVLKLKAESRAINAVCWLCLQSIDYDAKWPDPRSFTLDHVMPVSTHPHLADEPTNWRPCCSHCNLSRQDKPAVWDTGTPSRQW